MDRIRPRLLEDDSLDWLREADAERHDPLVGAVVLELEKTEGRERARETVHEALTLVSKKLRYPKALRILWDALSVFRRGELLERERRLEDGPLHLAASSRLLHPLRRVRTG
jgi:hypothetical protein